MRVVHRNKGEEYKLSAQQCVQIECLYFILDEVVLLFHNVPVCHFSQDIWCHPSLLSQKHCNAASPIQRLEVQVSECQGFRLKTGL